MSERDTLPVLAERVNRLEQESLQWISKDEFAPVRLLVYGMTAMALTAVVGAILALVIGKV